eukprot:1945579-Prymnesium_polylepis.2
MESSSLERVRHLPDVDEVVIVVVRSPVGTLNVDHGRLIGRHLDDRIAVQPVLSAACHRRSLCDGQAVSHAAVKIRRGAPPPGERDAPPPFSNGACAGLLSDNANKSFEKSRQNHRDTAAPIPTTGRQRAGGPK